MDDKGRVDALVASYTCSMGGATVTGTYSKGGVLSDEIDFVLKGLGFDQESEDEEAKKQIEVAKKQIKADIKAGFDQERQRIQTFADKVFGKHDRSKLENIRLAKIYPKNIAEVAQYGSPQQLALMLYRSPCDETTMNDRKNDLELALQSFVFHGSVQATGYGPVSDPRDIFEALD